MEVIHIQGQFKIKITTPKGRVAYIEHKDGGNYSLVFEEKKIDFTVATDTNFNTVKADFMQGMTWAQRKVWSSFKSTETGDVVQHVKSIFNKQSTLKKLVEALQGLKEEQIKAAKVEAEDRIIEELIAGEIAYIEAEDAAMRASISRDEADSVEDEVIDQMMRKIAEESIAEAKEEQRLEAVRIAREAEARRVREEEAARKQAEAEAKAAREAEIAEMKEAEARELARMEDQMKQLEAARAKADAAHKEHLAAEEARLQAEKLAVQAKLIETRKVHLDKLKAKLAAKDGGAEAAAAAPDQVLESHKPAPVKDMEAKSFICQEIGKNYIISYTSHSADSAGGVSNQVIIKNNDLFYSFDAKSEINGREIGKDITIAPKHYPMHKRADREIKVLPSDIKSYHIDMEGLGDAAAAGDGAKVANLDMFFLAFLCWDPNNISEHIGVFDKKHFDLEGYRYEGNTNLFGADPKEGCMLSFASTLDNDYVGDAIEAIEALGAAASAEGWG